MKMDETKEIIIENGHDSGAAINVKNLDIAKELIKKYEVDTGTKYSIYRKTPGFCSKDFDIKGHKILFEDRNSKIQQIKFNGTPFIINSVQESYCVHGKDWNLSQKKKRKEENRKDAKSLSFKKTNFLAQVTKKMDCPARILMRDVIHFPQYKIDANSDWKKRKATSKLKTDWNNDRSSIETERSVWITYPEKHEGHIIGGHVGGMSQPVDDRIIKKIYELVNEGVNQVREMERHLKIYVKNELFKNVPSPEAITDDSIKQQFSNFLRKKIRESSYSMVLQF